MKKIFALSAAAVLCLSVVALAGGEKMTEGKRISGTITKVDTDNKALTVKDKEGKELTIYWTESTKVEGGELKEGEMVFLKALEKEGKWTATRIHVGEMKEMKKEKKY